MGKTFPGLCSGPFYKPVWGRGHSFPRNPVLCFAFLLKNVSQKFHLDLSDAKQPLLLTLFSEDKENVLLLFPLKVFSVYLEMIILSSFSLSHL